MEPRRDAGRLTPMRGAALALLPKARGIFLRCDRGEALYVSNVPARADERADWESAGFSVRKTDSLLFLTPNQCWLEPFCVWAGSAHCESVRSLAAASFGEVEKADLRLWTVGVKLLEMGADEKAAAEYDRQVRQRAAVCLRQKRGGGTLKAAALCAEMIRQRGVFSHED